MIDASSTTRADMTVRVSTSDAHACVARAEALINATGLSTNSPLPTTQSNAFFNTPGTPCAYSGLEMSTASHRVQLGSKSGDRLEWRVVVEVRVERWQVGETAIHGHFD